MKKALISTQEPRETGYRVAQVVEAGNEFPVADWLFWTDCGDNVIADSFWYDVSDGSFQPLPASIVFMENKENIVYVTTFTNHYLQNNDKITMINQNPFEYSGEFTITVIDEKNFTYDLGYTPTEPIVDRGSYTINYNL